MKRKLEISELIFKIISYTLLTIFALCCLYPFVYAISAAIIAISPTSYEAAQIDGANKWAQMRYVVLPSILSTVIIMLITRIGHLLSVGYEKVILLYNVQTYQTADVVSTFSYRYGMESNLTGLASAAEMMNNLIGMMLVIGANSIAKKASNTSLY